MYQYLKDVEFPTMCIQNSFLAVPFYTSWYAWGSCDSTCGDGLQKRTRNCTDVKGADRGQDCEGVNNEEKPCVGLPECVGEYDSKYLVPFEYSVPCKRSVLIGVLSTICEYSVQFGVYNTVWVLSTTWSTQYHLEYTVHFEYSVPI